MTKWRSAVFVNWIAILLAGFRWNRLPGCLEPCGVIGKNASTCAALTDVINLLR